MNTILIASAGDTIPVWGNPNTWATVVIAVATVTAMLLTYSWTRRHKKMDVTMHFQEAYGLLEKEKTQVRDRTDAKSWFRRYWNLQIRQYEYWLHGYIPDEIYVYWMYCNKRDYDFRRRFCFYDAFGNPTLIEYDYSKGWNAVKNDIVLKQHPYFFTRFVERVLAHETDDTFARCILEAKADLFGWKVKMGRFLIGRIRSKDPRKLFRLRGC
ncbi:MAG TPA: hypothetical protein VGW57_00460 [Chthoniobacterales bacterium]|nr:hypothetical protein [Chthoniobacterales bacterium]